MNLWQSTKWAALQEKVGNTVFEMEGIFVIKKTLPFGWSMFEVQRANPSTKFWEKIEKKAAAENVLFCRVSAEKKTTPSNSPSPGGELHIPSHLKYHPTKLQRFPNATRIIDIAQTEEEILAQFSQTCRRHIRKAEKIGVTVETQNFASQKFAELSAVTAKRDGFSAHGKKYFDDFLQTLGEDAVLLVAKKNDIWLSAGIFCKCEDNAYYYYGASSSEERGTNAPTLLQWEAMKYFKKQGCKKFDLLGIAPENEPKNRLQGVTQFKKKFGGKIVEYEKEMNVIFSPWKYRFYRAAKKIRGFLR